MQIEWTPERASKSRWGIFRLQSRHSKPTQPGHSKSGLHRSYNQGKKHMYAYIHISFFQTTRYRRRYCTIIYLLETVMYTITHVSHIDVKKQLYATKNSTFDKTMNPQPSYAVQGYHNQ